MTLFGPDISNYQAGMSMSHIKDEGFDFVICKVSEGSGFRDMTWPGFRDSARAVGLILAGYHYVRGDVTADAQADTFVNHLGDKSIPAMLDFEENSGDLWQFWAVLHAIEARGVHVALSYIPRWYWSQIGFPDLSAVPGLIQSSYVGGTDYASALYPGDNSLNWTGYGGRKVDLLQFTSRALIDDRPVDCNAFRGTPAQLSALLGGTPQGADMTPEESRKLDVIYDQMTRNWNNPLDPAGTHGPGQGTLVEMAARMHYELTQVMTDRSGISPAIADTLLGHAIFAMSYGRQLVDIGVPAIIAAVAKMAADAGSTLTMAQIAEAVHSGMTDGVHVEIAVDGRVIP